MHRVVETICGMWELVRLAAKSRFRLRNSYWRWRRETAFGHDPDKFATRRQRFRAMLEYGRWVHRMRRASRL